MKPTRPKDEFAAATQQQTSETGSKGKVRLVVTVTGTVQGVGFRPFVYRLANELGVTGWVGNSPAGVRIEVEGESSKVDLFRARLRSDSPPLAIIQGMELAYFPPVGYESFEVQESLQEGTKTPTIPPDVATCSQCLAEIFNPRDRRFRYPFTNCTNCGPRYTIILDLPYDRPRTSMKDFVMCPSCRAEYENPADRRFHAQPNACPACGPQLQLWDQNGNVLAHADEALIACCEAIKQGHIVGVKGLGGFHIIVDARNENAVSRLRLLKKREEKPFAVMYPSLEALRQDCFVSELEQSLLVSPQAPIVLLKRKKDQPTTQTIAPSVAPGNPNLGAMLPYTPLHHLMLADLGFPVVATSGNLSEEPICIDENEAVSRLGKIADLFLVHDRPIIRHVDDSIVRVIGDRPVILRRARGFAPIPITLPQSVPPLVSVGAHQKSTVCVARGKVAVISQHIGDLETPLAVETFRKTTDDLLRLLDVEHEQVIHDTHPDYASTRYALCSGKKTASVQHHYAHVLACLADNELAPPALGVAWDGSGFGLDHTIWGGEFLKVDQGSFTRVATMRPFRLPGATTAVREPRRAALGALYEIFGDRLFEMHYLAPLAAFPAAWLLDLRTMLSRRINCPVTTSVGRLFDVVASLIGIRHTMSFEGQAAMEVEFVAQEGTLKTPYPFTLSLEPKPAIIDWQSMIEHMINDAKSGMSPADMASAFHHTLAEMIVSVAKFIELQNVVLTGGCFQNRYLTEIAIKRLREEGFNVYWHQRVPPNDGGIALGQVMAYLASRE